MSNLAFSSTVGSMNQTVVGRLIHPNGEPLTDQKVALYEPHWWKDRLISTSETDSKGNFTLSYIKSYQEKTAYHVILRIFEETVPSEGSGYKAIHGILKTIPIEPKIDLKDIVTELYEKQSHFPILKTPDDPQKQIQQMTSDFAFRLFKAGFDEKIKLQLLKIKNFISPVTTEEVQKLFGAKDPHLSLTEPHTIDMILNGIYPCKFFQTVEGDLKTIINWEEYEKESTPDLPNVSITLNYQEKQLSIKEIEIQYPNEIPSNSKPNESSFSLYLYVFNSMAMVLGETVSHLGFGHLMTDQLAAAFFRNINKHPIKKLLLPHFDGISVINHKGKKLIFGREGVLNISGLTEKGIDQVLRKYLSSLDYTYFQPSPPLTENHVFAKASQLYWKIVGEVIDQFFQENEKEICSPKHWYEIFNMSNTLVQDSLPFTEFEIKDPEGKWVDHLDYSPKDRIIFNDQLKALRPITVSESVPAEGDLDRLKQFCKFALYLVFNHWVVHSSQAKFLTNLQFGSLAPENRSQGPFGNTKPKNAERQLAVAHILTDFEPKKLVEDPYKVIYKPFIERLIKHKKEFADLGYDITKLHYSVMI